MEDLKHQNELILKKRAEILARKTEEQNAEKLYEIIAFKVGDEKFGIECEYVLEISRNSVSRIPMTPDYIAGIANIRGKIVDVVKLDKLLGIDVSEKTDMLLTISGNELEFACRVNEVFGIREISQADIQEKPNASDILDRRGWLKAVTIDGVQVIDGAKALTDMSLIVDEGV